MAQNFALESFHIGMGHGKNATGDAAIHILVDRLDIATKGVKAKVYAATCKHLSGISE